MSLNVDFQYHTAYDDHEQPHGWGALGSLVSNRINQTRQYANRVQIKRGAICAHRVAGSGHAKVFDSALTATERAAKSSLMLQSRRNLILPDAHGGHR